MTINKQSLKLVNITEEEYLSWCKENHKAAYKQSTKQEFFKLINENKIIKNEDGKLKTL